MLPHRTCMLRRTCSKAFSSSSLSLYSPATTKSLSSIAPLSAASSSNHSLLSSAQTKHLSHSQPRRHHSFLSTSSTTTSFHNHSSHGQYNNRSLLATPTSFASRSHAITSQPFSSAAQMEAAYEDLEDCPQWNRLAGSPLIAKALAQGALPPIVSAHPEVAARGAELPEGAPDKFAVVAVNKRQFKVVAGDLIMVTTLKDVDVGTMINLDKVLMVAGRHATVIGRPLVQGASVTAEVQEHATCEDVIVFKMKRRKGYKKTNIANARVTILRIDSVNYTENAV